MTRYTLLLLFMGLALTSRTYAQLTIVAPDDIVLSCSYELDLHPDSLMKLSHPVLGKVVSDTSLRSPISINDVVCDQMCLSDSRIGYDSLSDLGLKACDYYTTLFTGDIYEIHTLNWGFDGYVLGGYDTVYIELNWLREDRNGYFSLERIFIADSSGFEVRDTQLVLGLYCNRFFVNLDNIDDTTDCWVVTPGLEKNIYIFDCGKVDSMLNDTNQWRLPQFCNECGLISWDYNDEVIQWDSAYFFIIERTWILVDWCVYDQLDPRPPASREGRWEYKQYLWVFCESGNLKGRIYYDEDLDCTLDTTEYGLKNWLVKASSPLDTFTTISSFDGTYSLPLVVGDNYQVEAFAPNTAWSTCLASWNVRIDSNDQVVINDIGATGDSICRNAVVEVEVTRFRACFENRCIIEYGNEGTETISSGVINLKLDDDLELVFADFPYVDLGGHEFEFQVGDIAPGMFDIINLDVLVICDSADLGEALCIEAIITPTDTCELAGYQGPIVETSALCIGDSVVLEIQNIGHDMLSSLEYWVVEDDLILFLKTFQLDSLDKIREVFPANGKTYIIVAQQAPDYLLERYSASGIEGCVPGGSGISLGFLNQYSISGISGNSDLLCSEVVSSFDPNDKSARPTGITNENYIDSLQEIVYTIRFQNVGTDTAFNVRIEDYFPNVLDLETIRILTSSHDYRLEVRSEISDYNGLIFHFENIHLVDSFTNEPGSNGFVKFAIRPLLPIDEGTKIENVANIYFDFNEPVRTNTVFHTIGRPFIVSTADGNKSKKIALEIGPNPTTGSIWMHALVKDVKINNFHVFNSYGIVHNEEREVDDEIVSIDLEGYPTGVYYIRIELSNGEKEVFKVVKL